MPTYKKCRVSTFELVNIIGYCCTFMHAELSTCVIYSLAFHIQVAKKSPFYQTQSSTLYLGNIIGYGVAL